MDWDAIRCFFNKQGPQKLTEHQIESYEDFIRNKIPLIITSNPPIIVWHEQDPISKKYKYEFRLSFENVSYLKPRIQISLLLLINAPMWINMLLRVRALEQIIRMFFPLICIKNK